MRHSRHSLRTRRTGTRTAVRNHETSSHQSARRDKPPMKRALSLADFMRNKADETDETDSDVSSIDETLDESIYDRIAALKDVVPPAQRRQLAATVSTAQEWGWWGISSVAQVSWLVGVSVMLLGIPFAVGMSEEQALMAEEQQAQMQESANDVRTQTPRSQRMRANNEVTDANAERRREEGGPVNICTNTLSWLGNHRCTSRALLGPWLSDLCLNTTLL